MTFEAALRAELITITGLSNKVYPVNAPEGTAAPYVTYESGLLDEEKTLGGFLTSGSLECSLDVLGATYGDMKSYSKAVKAKVKTFVNRTIGTGGPFIQDIEFAELAPELYESEVNMYRCIITFTAYYQEV